MAMTYFAQPPMRRDQTQLFYPTLDDLIPTGHAVRILDELVDGCDLSEFERQYHGARGQPPIPPRVLVKAWLYGLSLRIRSSRRLEYAVEHNLDFKWLVQGHTIDHVTLSNFRKKFGKQLRALFRQFGRLALCMGFVRLNEITFDGTRVKANNSRSETLTAAGIEQRLERLDQELQRHLAESSATDAAEDAQFGGQGAVEMPPELADLRERMKRLEKALATVREMDEERRRRGLDPAKNPAQLPMTDPDSRVMPNKEGGAAPNYTPLAAVDAHGDFIVAAGVIADVNEHGQTVSIVEQVAADFGVRPERLLADGLHATGQNIAAFENSGTELISPLPEAAAAGPNPAVRPDPTQPVPEADWPQLPRNPQGQLDKSCFVYQAEEDVYHCPQGQPLAYEETKPRMLAGDQKVDVRIYRCAACAGCPLAQACLSKRTVHGRTISRDEFTPERERHAAKMATAGAKEVYKKRLHAGETPFAHIKHVLGLRQFLLRGLPQVETEWLWSCTAYNVMKLVRYIGDLRTRFAPEVVAEA